MALSLRAAAPRTTVARSTRPAARAAVVAQVRPPNWAMRARGESKERESLGLGQKEKCRRRGGARGSPRRGHAAALVELAHMPGPARTPAT